MVKCKCGEMMEFSYSHEKGRHVREVYICPECNSIKTVKGRTIRNKALRRW